MTISSVLLLSFPFSFSLFPHYPTFFPLARMSKAVLLRRGLLFAYALLMFHTLPPISLSSLVFSSFSPFSLALFLHHAIFSSIRPKRSPQRSGPLSFFLPSASLAFPLFYSTLSPSFSHSRLFPCLIRTLSSFRLLSFRLQCFRWWRVHSNLDFCVSLFRHAVAYSLVCVSASLALCLVPLQPGDNYSPSSIFYSSFLAF